MGHDADDLICRHLALVRHAVGRLATRVPPHVDRQDLQSAGHLGLVQAALAFDPSRGVPFERYALRRVTGAIQDELRSLDPSSRRGRAAVRRLDQATEVLAMRLGRLPSTPEVARWLGEDAAGVERDGREVKSIAAEFGVTPSRVSQLCGEALALLRRALKDADGAPARAGAA